MWARATPLSGTVHVFDDDKKWGDEWLFVVTFSAFDGVAYLTGLKTDHYGREARKAIFKALADMGFHTAAWLRRKQGKFILVTKRIN